MMPPNVSRETDRHGNERYYFRRTGRRIRLRALPGSVEFFHEIEAAATAMPLPQRPRKEAGPFVYFALYGSNARVKIGTAKDPRKRLKSIATGAPGKVRIYYVTPGGKDLEKALHEKFARDRVNGEWFIYSKEIREWIEADEARRNAPRAAR